MIVISYLWIDSDTRMLHRDECECENMFVGVIAQTFAISMCAILRKVEDFMGGK